MLGNILMFSGIVLIAAGSIWLINLVIDPLRKSFHIMFHRDWNYLAYEKGIEGQEAVDRARRVLSWPGIIAIILGVILLISGLYLKLNPGGSSLSGSLDSEFTAEESTDEGYSLNAAEYYEAMTDNTHLIVSVDVIYFAGRSFPAVEGFEAYIKTLPRMQEAIVIADDFAVSATFHSVADILNSYGFSYELAGEW